MEMNMYKQLLVAAFAGGISAGMMAYGSEPPGAAAATCEMVVDFSKAVVPDVTGTVGTVYFNVTPDADPAYSNVRAEIPASPASSAGNLFGRLNATEN
jgi:hypothetical protein